MSSVVQLLHELAERHGPKTALVTLGWDDETHDYVRGEATTYRQLYADALRLADALAARGLAPGDRLAVLLDNSVELVVTEWACLLSGLVWVALNVRSSASEQAAILADCEPGFFIVSPRRLAELRAAGTAGGADAPAARASRGVDVQAACAARGCEVVETGPAWEALLASGRERVPDRSPGPEDPVRIRYTSGTAGLPKGAVLPRRCYDASVEVVADVIGPLGADDVLAQVAPMTHAAGAMWLPHAVVGATALLADRFDAAAFARLAERERVTAAFLVPTMLLRYLEVAADLPRPARLRTIVYGGAAMPVDRLEKGLELLGPVFVQIYGLTESNWPVTALGREEHLVDGPPPARRRRLASCGRPTAVGELRIVGEGGREAAPGESGELLVRGRNTMLGYWSKGPGGGAPGALARTDAKGLDDDGWMHTGDVALRDQDGFVTIVDRLHDMIVSGGFNVYPREVEDALSSHPGVLESAVVGRPHAEWGETVHAVVVLRPGAAVAAEDLAAHVAALTASYKKPRSFEFVAELPRNASGKVLRRALRTTKPPA